MARVFERLDPVQAPLRPLFAENQVFARPPTLPWAADQFRPAQSGRAHLCRGEQIHSRNELAARAWPQAHTADKYNSRCRNACGCKPFEMISRTESAPSLNRRLW